ncbi:alpha/beta fold hydrolase [Pseudonocardia oceani]|uniref:Alpha/beta fold hydrolase n=1 Tax=Pseudonocardia oceani TaxID=2792013 RepID=A0ABS6UAQ8_9PSEU|nr:alpha/beta fold hydrolase [Pseudonocardia oceani]MBW0091111.1 alpha/beta fold hydrolase [Pseudonocardia oceani]MBW0110808.1 alpha/beta fold hydrolase [Pseudonocardia oceani]MBW0123795.1 alpha/beta fold hydrolase [Pseudonocardia oceani]MBW0129327.1 alpha/beta fold hydrolase [Pseudonocardia oceani]
METLLPVGDVELCVDTHGSPTDPALLLIGTTVAAWDDELVDRLTDRYVIRYDPRDAGRSTTVDPDSPGYTLRDLVTDAVGVLDGLGIARAHVAGLGTGGFVAQLLALDHPERVASLALVGTRPVAPGPADADLPEHAPAVMAHFRDAPPIDWTDRASILDGAVAGARVLSASPGFDEDEARARAAAVLDRSGPHPASARNSLLGTVFAALDCTPRWRERLGAIAAPTLVVHGAADPFFPVGNAHALAAEIPGAALLVLDGVGAELPRRAHAEVAAALLAHTTPA